MAGSLLHAAGVPELVTYTLADYEATALRLATQPGALGALRERLAAARAHAPLFDCARFTRHLESAYAEMAARFRNGRPRTRLVFDRS